MEIKHGKLQCLEIHLVIKIVLIYIGALVDFHTIIEVPSPKKVIKEDAEIKHNNETNDGQNDSPLYKKDSIK